MGNRKDKQQPDLFNMEGVETFPQKKRVASKTKATCTKCHEVFVSVHDVAARYNVLPSTIWRWLKKAPEFPAPVKLTPGTTRWRLSDLVSYEAKRARSNGKCQTGRK
ncbi:hypothetical protein N4R57_06455 [Rhodobacteraceae bacterium D3-12]|nr:hypothetical protein N4R57_06455 [Rhodobacteraceae bacterium D3-12]